MPHPPVLSKPMSLKQIIKLTIFALLALSLCACTKSSSGDGSDDNESPPDRGDEIGARLNCGAVVNGKVINPVNIQDGEAVRIDQAGDSNAVIVTTATGGKILVKLHGISNDPVDLRNNAVSFIDRYSGNNALFVKAGSNCSATVTGGGSAQLGQLVTSSGASIAEDLVRTGFANSGSGDGCGSELVAPCLKALQESDPVTAGELNSFLWKPQADSDGNLAVHTGPSGTTVTINGEVGINQGAGNGYGSLARFSKPGCAYGSPRITVRASNGLAYTVGGQTSFSVPAPCGRHCLIGELVIACAK